MKKSSIFKRGCVALFLVAWLSLLAVPASAQEGTYPIEPSPLELTWSPSGEYLMTGYIGGFILWDGDTGDLVQRYPLPLSDGSDLRAPSVRYPAWSPDSTRLAVLINAEDRKLRVIAIPSGDTVFEVGADEYCCGITWSPDGTRIATVYAQSVRSAVSVRILDASNGQVLLDIPATRRGDGGKVKWSPNGTTLAAALDADEWGSALIFYDGLTGAELGRIPHENSVSDFAWSPDGTRVVTVMTRATIDQTDDQQTVRVWDVATGAMLNRFMSRISDVDWSPTDNLLAGSIGASIGILDLTGSILYQADASPIAAVWKPDGTIVAGTGLTPVLMTREGAVLPQRPTMFAFSIVDLEANRYFGDVADGMQIDPTTFDVVGESQIRSITSVDDGGSVVFNLSGMVVVDNDRPFSIPLPPPGSYTLTATPYNEPDGQGTEGFPLTVNFTVVGD